jgi:hypothetical protein
VNKSARKITRRFDSIERLELENGEENPLNAALDDVALDEEENGVEPLAERSSVSEEEHKPQLLFDSQFD